MAHMTFVVDLDRCIGCRACEVACKQENAVELGQAWNKVLTVGPTGIFPDVQMYFLPTMCQVCANPACVSVCPASATYKNEEGVIVIDREKCIGCKRCIKACPYGSRSFNKAASVAEKCTTCPHLRAVGENPACIKACPGKARFFGDLDDPNSDVSKVLAAAGEAGIHHLPEDKGNAPTARYVLHSRIAGWIEPTR